MLYYQPRTPVYLAAVVDQCAVIRSIAAIRFLRFKHVTDENKRGATLQLCGAVENPTNYE